MPTPPSQDWADLFDVRDKVAVVTGGTRGLGFMIAEGLLRAGAVVHITSRDEEACAAAVLALGQLGRVSATPSDLSSETGVRLFSEGVAARWPAVDILVNNAGTTWSAPLEEFPEAGFDKVFNLNVKAVFLLTRALLPQLRRAASAESPARVVNISSVHGSRVPGVGVNNFSYSSAKSALNMLSCHLAHELAGDNITVNALAPGFFPSRLTAPMLEDDSAMELLLRTVPLARTGQPQDIAAAVIFLCSRAGAYVTGANLPVDGGLNVRD